MAAGPSSWPGGPIEKRKTKTLAGRHGRITCADLPAGRPSWLEQKGRLTLRATRKRGAAKCCCAGPGGKAIRLGELISPPSHSPADAGELWRRSPGAWSPKRPLPPVQATAAAQEFSNGVLDLLSMQIRVLLLVRARSRLELEPTDGWVRVTPSRAPFSISIKARRDERGARALRRGRY